MYLLSNYVIEFQKHGLPNAHILVTLHKNDIPKNPKEFDNFFQAQIPDKNKEPKLFQAVSDHMLHNCQQKSCVLCNRKM